MPIEPFSTLISAETLSEKLRESPKKSDWVVIDCRFSLLKPDSGRVEYQNGHIPGAQYAHLDNDLSSPQYESSGRHPLPARSQWISRLESWGVRPDSQVIVYDHGSGAVAARLWWMLRWSGHMSVALLDGGFGAWRQAGLPDTTEIPEIKQTTYPAGIALDQNLWISTQQLESELSEITLLDVRNAERFDGISEPIDPVAGHIPGAINMPLADNLNDDAKFLSPDRLRERFTKLSGISETQRERSRIVHMCGSGVTACHNILAMEIAGLPGSRLYVGSWSEWIRDPRRRVVRANP
jgi:thiosulfate/3-mercaptopyruvate sulfurtransferase